MSLMSFPSPHTQAQEPLPRGIMKFKILVVRPFLGHHNYILNLSAPCPTEEKIRNIAFSQYDLYDPAPGVMKFKMLVDPSLVILIIHL